MALLFIQLISCRSHTQDQIDFKVRYKPSLNYNSTFSRSSHSEMTYKGSEDFLRKIKSKGVDNPTITDNQQLIQAVFRTGKLTGSDKFPIAIEFIKTTSSNGNKEIPDGTKIYGKGSIGELPIIDSVSSGELTQEYKDALKQSMQSLLSQINLPEKKVKVGEQFTRDNPLNFPVAGVTLEATIKTIYKLVSISHDTANFDISQVYTFITDLTGHIIKAEGNGKGKLLYDIKNNFYLLYQIDIKMDTQLSLDNYELEIKSSSSSIKTTSITTE